ncbi:MAG: TIGR03013 family PEP-CTERM/XrtA system glycosyltransferase [Desulfobulbaceae bacterium]|jgi:sugar transferase (PEP-CTERM system associated)|nr:TIGR03013 family PEP-CTERM/XrtA system glycosyltransferase [Desulfobulbaceae bacterium]
MPFFLKKQYPLRNIVFFCGEGWLIFLSILAAYWLMLGSGLFMLDLTINCLHALVVTAVFQLCLYFFDLYDLKTDSSLPDTFTRITQAFGVGCVILGSLYYLAPKFTISGQVFWFGYLVICVTVFLWRFLYYIVLRKRLFVQKVVIIGVGDLACEIAHEIERRLDSVYSVYAFVGDEQPACNPRNAPVARKLEDLLDDMVENDVEHIIVAPENRRGSMPLDTLLRCKLRGMFIDQGVSFYERVTGRIPVQRVDPSWLIFSQGFSITRWRATVQRFFDVVVSLAMLVITSPIMLITAIAVRLESPGPILYRQERVGLYSAPFQVLKFRSMRQDAEKNGAVWAAVNDSRVTRCGAFIRKARIDELPQLWNVLKGEMSLVGPRPERPVFVEELIELIPFYEMRHDVKPGLTGWAQINYPYGSSVEDALRKLEYDLYYVKHMSLALDAMIIFRTVKTVLFQRGSR